MPILSVPIMGSINYFQNGQGDGVLVIVFAMLALLFVWRHSYHLLWIPGFGSLAVLAFTFINLQIKMSEMKTDMSRDLAGNPFRGLAEAMAGSVQLQWGWAVLVVGAVSLLGAAFSKDPPGSRVGLAQTQAAGSVVPSLEKPLAKIRAPYEDPFEKWQREQKVKHSSRPPSV